MIKEILAQDTRLFIFINHLPHNFLMDTFFGVLTFSGIYGSIYLVFAIIQYFKNKKKFKRQMIALLLAEVIYIFLIEIFLKNIIVRPRPQFSIADVVLPYDFSRSFSFPSGHSTIVFAAAFILGRGNKRHKWFYYLFAFLIDFSRIYLGKHYPSDVVVGALFGLVIGKLSLIITGWITKKPISIPEVED